MKRLMIKNIQKNKFNYMLQGLTMTLIIAVMYSFLNLAMSEELVNISENLSLFKGAILVLVLITTYVSGIVIGYVSKYMFLQRNREFATYILLGVKRKRISRLFFMENSLIAFMAMGVGVLIGGGISKVISGSINGVFERHIIELRMFEIKPFIYTLLLSLLITGIGSFFSIKKITKEKVVHLLYAEKQRQRNVVMTSRRSFIGLIFAVIFIVSGFYCARQVLTSSSNVAYGYLILMSGFFLVGLYLLQKDITALIFYGISRRPNWIYNDKRLYVIESIKSRFAAKRKLMSVITIIATLSMLSMVIAIIFGSGYRETIEREYPYDITVGIDVGLKNFDDLHNFISTQYTIDEQVFFYLYDWNENYCAIALSDYNRLRRFLGYKTIELEEADYAIHAETSALMSQAVKDMKASPLILNENLDLEEPMETYRTMGENGLVLIMRDELLKEYKPTRSRYVAKSEESIAVGFKSALQDYMRQSFQPILLDGQEIKHGKVTMYINTKAWGVNNSLSGFLMILFIGLYLCLIFIIFSATILGFDGLSELDYKKRDYKVLHELGYKKKIIRRLIKGDLFVLFYYPLLIPILSVVMVLILLKNVLNALVISDWMMGISFFYTMFIFLSLYTMFYGVTKWLYMKGINQASINKIS